MADPYESLRAAMRELEASCDGHAPTHIEAPDHIKAKFQRAAEAGINPKDYATLAECISAIEALES